MKKFLEEDVYPFENENDPNKSTGNNIAGGSLFRLKKSNGDEGISEIFDLQPILLRDTYATRS